MRIPFILLFFVLSFNIQSQELIPYRFNATWGFADENGNIVIPTEFDEVTSFDESGHARVCIKKEWGIINKQGEIIIPIKYTAIFNFKEGLAAACKDGKYHWLQGEIINGAWGFINEKGEEVIPFKYHRAESFYNGHAIVQIVGDNWGNWGVIDKTGKQILPYKYPTYSFDMRPFPGLRWDEQEKGKLLYRPSQDDEVWRQIDLKGNLTGKKVSDIHGEYASDDFPSTIEKNGKYALKSRDGKMLTEYIYDFGIYFYEDYQVATIVKDTLYGLMDKNGKVLIEPIYEHINIVGKDRLIIQSNGKYFLTNLKAESKMDGVTDEIKYLGEDIASVKNGDSFELVTYEGRKISTEKFEQTGWKFEDSLLRVKKSDKWGFIDTQGKIIIECKYPYVEDFKNGLAKVDMNPDQYKIPDEGFINKKGVEFFNSNKKIMRVQNQNGREDLLDEYGNTIRKNIYGFQEIFPDIICYRENGVLRVMNQEGKNLINEKIDDFIPSCIELDPDLNEGMLCFYAGITNDTVYIYNRLMELTQVLNGPWISLDINLFRDKQLVIERNGRERLKSASGDVIGKSYEKIYYYYNYIRVHGKNDSCGIMDENGKMISEYKKQNILNLDNHYVSFTHPSKSTQYADLFDYAGKKINQYPMNIFNQSYNLYGFYHTENTKTKKEGYFWNGIFKEAIYDEITTFKLQMVDFVIVNDNGKLNIFSKVGRLALSDEFESIHVGSSAAVVKRKGKYGVIGIKNGELDYYLPCEYDFIPDIHLLTSPVAVKKDGKFIYVDYNGEKMIDEELDRITPFEDRLFTIVGKNNFTGVINKDGSWFIAPEYDYLEYHTDYADARAFSGRKNGKPILLNHHGINVIHEGIDSLVFDQMENYGQILSMKGKKKGIIDFQGKIIIPVKYDDIRNFWVSNDKVSLEYFLVETETGFGYLDSAGNEISSMDYDRPSENDDIYIAADLNLIPVSRKGKYGAINFSGKEVLPCEYNEVDWYLNEGEFRQIAISKKGKWGLMGTDAKMLLECSYEKIHIDYEIMDNFNIQTPIYSLKQNGKYGLSDQDGKLIYPCLYTEIKPEYDCDVPDYLSLIIGKKKGIGDLNGKTILPCEFQDIGCGMFDGNLFFITWKSKKGTIHFSDGSLLSVKEYDAIDWSGDEGQLAIVKRNGIWYSLSSDGSEKLLDE